MGQAGPGAPCWPSGVSVSLHLTSARRDEAVASENMLTVTQNGKAGKERKLPKDVSNCNHGNTSSNTRSLTS